MNIGKAIKLCRTQLGLSQTELAIIAELSDSYLSLLERGKRDPAFSTVEKIACALKVPLIVVVFLASNEEEKAMLNSELREKLSYSALRLLEEVK